MCAPGHLLLKEKAFLRPVSLVGEELAPPANAGQPVAPDRRGNLRLLRREQRDARAACDAIPYLVDALIAPEASGDASLQRKDRPIAESGDFFSAECLGRYNIQHIRNLFAPVITKRNTVS